MMGLRPADFRFFRFLFVSCRTLSRPMSSSLITRGQEMGVSSTITCATWAWAASTGADSVGCNRITVLSSVQFSFVALCSIVLGCYVEVLMPVVMPVVLYSWVSCVCADCGAGPTRLCTSMTFSTWLLLWRPRAESPLLVSASQLSHCHVLPFSILLHASSEPDGYAVKTLG